MFTGYIHAQAVDITLVPAVQLAPCHYPLPCLALWLVLRQHATFGAFNLTYAAKWMHNGVMELDKVFKALADPSRRQLLDQLYANNGQTLNELCTGLAMARQSVSKHLALLEEAALIEVVWRGREKLHYLNPLPIQAIYDRWIGKYERSRLQALSVLKQTLEAQVTGQPPTDHATK